MNYFFNINDDSFNTKLTIAKFQNHGRHDKSIKIFSATVDQNRWKINEVNCEENNNFYIIESDFHNSKNIYFLAHEEDIIKLEKVGFKYLMNINNFTETLPAFRANLKIFNKFGGFSSYQSEYPFSMINRKGSVLSPISSITNKNADLNRVYLKNIYYKPSRKKFRILLFNIKSNSIIKEYDAYTNETNIIDIDKKYIDPNIIIFSKNYLCVPVFLSMKNNHLSLEHTHPPHEYILSNNKFHKVSEIKKKIDEITY